MILYQDSDSICKRYLRDEIGGPEAQRAIERSNAQAVSWISYAEVRAALAAAHRANRFLSDEDYLRAKRDFEDDWQSYLKLSVSPDLVWGAGSLAERHSLRAYDALHLASILSLNSPDTLEVSTWDRFLRRALVSEGFVLAHEVTT